MQKLIICLILCLAFNSLQAQRFNAEIQGGVAGSQVSGDQLSGFNKAGIIFGAGVNTPVDEKWFLDFRFLYFQKGSRSPSKLSQGDPTYYRLRLNYIEMPLQIRYKLGKKFYAEAGPSLGYLIGHKEENQDGEFESVTPFINFDLSITGALGYSISNFWDFQFAGWQSVLPVREHNGGEEFRLNSGQFNSVISFCLMYKFQSAHNKTEE